ncbi:gamma-glutamyltransferase [Panacibacter ginsenosidivorans]|uniref:Glutathione hydrolase proenzyme n=1 Tax=Panacibacter ginsenosidivorans TaxID=1813871 RepID=A0A5B8VBY2_9BACT|nr:gamma-glutamyltransferase [Panacibacter ginsenosidivorans]QEC68513.1 gamma-glutamyltransferase [Panacibacter ginsenosidivorans]
MKKTIVFILFLITSTANAQQSASIVGAGKTVDPYHYASVKSVTFNKAVVASAHPLASEVGAAIMKQGGNAFDAMIATQLTLAVVYPGAGNLGGGGFLIARKSDGKSVALDYREMAPAKASRDMYLDKDGNAQNELSENGHLSSGVPGTVAGLFATMPFAKLSFKALIQPAIDLAEYGFVITAHEAAALNSTKEDFLKYSSQPSAFIKDQPWKAGDTLIQPQLAATLKRIRDNGSKGFYEGETAKLIVEEMQRGNGMISYDDLKNYTVKQRTAIAFDYRGYNIISFPPPSSGGILLAQMLKMIEKYPVGSYGFQSAKSVQLMIEAERRAYADRAQHMGDPDYWKVPQKTLMSDAYLAERMKDYNPNKASVSADIKAGTIHESEETTHISIIDEQGNMVAVTTTLNNSYGSKTVVDGAGFILNDEMDDFSIKPGVPNMYGAIGGEANAIAAGKRMLSSMTPTLVLKGNKPFMVVGTPGGTTIPTSVFQSIVNVIDFNMNATDAVNKPKFHHQWLPDEVMVESNFSAETKMTLEKMGYKMVDRGGIGRTELIKILADGKRESAADGRGDDSVAGY